MQVHAGRASDRVGAREAQRGRGGGAGGLAVDRHELARLAGQERHEVAVHEARAEGGQEFRRDALVPVDAVARGERVQELPLDGGHAHQPDGRERVDGRRGRGVAEHLAPVGEEGGLLGIAGVASRERLLQRGHQIDEHRAQRRQTDVRVVEAVVGVGEVELDARHRPIQGLGHEPGVVRDGAAAVSPVGHRVQRGVQVHDGELAGRLAEVLQRLHQRGLLDIVDAREHQQSVAGPAAGGQVLGGVVVGLAEAARVQKAHHRGVRRVVVQVGGARAGLEAVADLGARVAGEPLHHRALAGTGLAEQPQHGYVGAAPGQGGLDLGRGVGSGEIRHPAPQQGQGGDAAHV